MSLIGLKPIFLSKTWFNWLKTAFEMSSEETLKAHKLIQLYQCLNRGLNHLTLNYWSLFSDNQSSHKWMSKGWFKKYVRRWGGGGQLKAYVGIKTYVFIMELFVQKRILGEGGSDFWPFLRTYFLNHPIAIK